MLSALIRRSNAGGGSSSGPTVLQIQAFNSSTTSVALANGKVGLQLRNAQTDWILFSFVATVTGTYQVAAKYQMQAANSGNVELNIGSIAVADGEDPSATITQGTDFVVTPGNDALSHTLDSGDDAGLAIAATAGDEVTVKIGRTNDAADTHTSDLYITSVTVTTP